MSFQKSQTWLIAAGVLAVVVLAAGWFLLVAPAQSNASDLAVQAEATQAKNATTQVQIQQLREQSKDLPAQEQKIAEIRTRIPETPAQPTLIRSLSDIAKNAGVTLDTVTPGAPVLPAAVPGAPASASLVTGIPMQVQVTGEFANVRLFVNGLETLKRSFLVTGLNIARGAATESTNSLTAAITGQVFMSPPVTATPVAPAPAASAAPAS